MKFVWPREVKKSHRWLFYGYLILAVVLAIGQFAPFAFLPFRHALLLAVLIGLVWGVVSLVYEFVLLRIFKPYFDKHGWTSARPEQTGKHTRPSADRERLG